MQNRSSAARSGRVFAAGRSHALALTLAVVVSGGCRNEETPTDAGTEDLAMPSDLAMAPIKPTTIRELNTPMGDIKTGDRVRLSGVVISPRTWVTFDDKDTDWCNYRLILMYADGSPTTLRDGVAVTLSLRTTFVAGSDMSPLSACTTLGRMDPVGTELLTASPGDQIELEGKLSTRGTGASATRQVDVFKGLVKNQGQATMMPVPLDADPLTYEQLQTGLAPAFADAQGVLVTFKNVTVHTRDMMYQDFNVSPTGMGGARIATNFMRVGNPMFMSPANGTMLKSVTGIVTGDFKGTIWPRAEADIVP